MLLFSIVLQLTLKSLAGLLSSIFRSSSKEIRNRITQTRKAINTNSIWRNKDITKNIKLYIYKTITQSILTYGSEVWQIPNRELNRILATEMHVLRRLTQKSRIERTKNEIIIANTSNKEYEPKNEFTRHIKLA